jgi:hypothetical protein
METLTGVVAAEALPSPLITLFSLLLVLLDLASSAEAARALEVSACTTSEKTPCEDMRTKASRVDKGLKQANTRGGLKAQAGGDSSWYLLGRGSDVLLLLGSGDVRLVGGSRGHRQRLATITIIHHIRISAFNVA